MFPFLGAQTYELVSPYQRKQRNIIPSFIMKHFSLSIQLLFKHDILFRLLMQGIFHSFFKADTHRLELNR